MVICIKSEIQELSMIIYVSFKLTTYITRCIELLRIQKICKIYLIFQIPSTTQLKLHIQTIINLLLIFHKRDSYLLSSFHSIYNIHYLDESLEKFLQISITKSILPMNSQSTINFDKEYSYDFRQICM